MAFKSPQKLLVQPFPLGPGLLVPGTGPCPPQPHGHPRQAYEAIFPHLGPQYLYSSCLILFLRFCLFLKRGEGREKERERNIEVWVPLARPQLGTWPTAEACALTGNQTGDPLDHGPALSPLSHTSQGLCPFFTWIVCFPGVESYEFFI